MDDCQEALAAINSVASVDNTAELQKLEAALDKLFRAPQPERGIDTLFHLYERFPDDDGYGVFWSVLHGLEKLPGYEPFLQASVRRVPMEFNLLMVNRILNSQLPNTQRQEWLSLLGEVEANPRSSKNAKEQARESIEYQSQRSHKGN